jgi:hypothetical protein
MHSFAQTLLVVLTMIGALPTIGGILVLVAIEPKPVTVQDHLRGLSRYLIVGGAAFHVARLVSGISPRWEFAALMLGLGFAMAIHAREIHLLAKLQEKLEDGQESGA